MTDINLNPQLTARLRAVQAHWGHDNISETLALILDAVTNKWDIPTPNTAHIVVDKAARVRLRARHVAYFAQMSQMSGLGTTELARSVLIQWLCLPQNTLLLPEHTQMSPQNRQSSPASTPKQLNPTRKRVKTASTPPKEETVQPKDTQMSPQTIEASPEETPQPTKLTGRSALSGLMSKK
jgi:hypothetical protein